jgi:hypothetical protein
MGFQTLVEGDLDLGRKKAGSGCDLGLNSALQFFQFRYVSVGERNGVIRANREVIRTKTG